MSENKSRVPSLRNEDCRTIKVETKQINELFTNISTNNITESNELIYSGAKWVF